MSGPALEALLRDAYDALQRDGVRAFESALAPDVALLLPEQMRHRRMSRDEVLEQLDELGWGRLRVEPLDFTDVGGGRVVVLVREVDPSAPAKKRGLRSHYWTTGPAGADRLELHRGPAKAHNAAVGYVGLLERLHERLRPRTYVEIGVHVGRSLGRVRPGTTSIGIDPDPKITDPAVEDAARIFRTTSDDFFRDHDLRLELGGLPVDLAFIDGMHLFENALRDFMHLERYCSPQSVIMFHDCYPAGRIHAEREPQTVEWCGDVWKLVPCLREQRPDLNVHVIDIRPQGMGIITGLDPDSTVLWDSYDEVEARYLALGYEWVEEAQAQRLARLDHDWEQIEALLPPAFGASAAPVGESAA